MDASAAQPRSRSQINRDRILDAARTCFADDPDASMDDVAKAAGVVRRTVYAHFPSRDVLVEGLADDAAASLARALDLPEPDDPAVALTVGVLRTWPVPDDRALFVADAVSTAWMGVERSAVGPGDVVAIWGAGAVGQMAARAAGLLGAERVIVIDRYQYRLDLAERAGAETIDYTETDVQGELRDRTGGRGPDVCIEAVGMQPHNSGPQLLYDRARKQIRFSAERQSPVEQAVHACRKGGNVFVLGLFTRPVERFPLDAVMHKSLTLRSAQQHGQRYVPMLLERMARDEIRAERLATHRMPLTEAAKGYELFRDRADQCVRAVFTP